MTEQRPPYEVAADALAEAGYVSESVYTRSNVREWLTYHPKDGDK